MPAKISTATSAPISTNVNSNVKHDNGSDSDDIDIKAADAAFVPAKTGTLHLPTSIVNSNVANESDSDDIDTRHQNC